VESIAPKIGRVPQTLLVWVKRQKVDTGLREGVSTTETQRVKVLERKVMELCYSLCFRSYPCQTRAS
jgi:transposase-like protein